MPDRLGVVAERRGAGRGAGECALRDPAATRLISTIDAARELFGNGAPPEIRINGGLALTGNTQVTANERYSRLAGAYGPVSMAVVRPVVFCARPASL